MISVDKLALHFGGFELFREISFLINPRDRIGLTGKNGAGKTTLLKIIAGIDQPSSGKVSMPKELTIGYLPQVMNVTDTRNVREEARLAFEPLLRLKREINDLHHQIAHRTDYHSTDYLRLLESVHDKEEHYRILGGDNYEAELEQTLTGLGFERSDFGRNTSEFSGGWRMRIELAKLLLRKPDVFLLDEPTNHLDMRSKELLKKALAAYDGTVLVVSHDREFLDGLVTCVYEFRHRKVKQHLGGIYDFLRRKKMESLRELELRKSVESSGPGSGPGTPAGGTLSSGGIPPGENGSGNSSGNRQSELPGNGSGSPGIKTGHLPGNGSGSPGYAQGVRNSGSGSTGTSGGGVPRQELSFNERKEVNRAISRCEKNIAAIEEKIAQLEADIADMDNLLADSSRITSEEVFLNYEKIKQQLADTLTQWEEEHTELEKWQSKKHW